MLMTTPNSEPGPGGPARSTPTDGDEADWWEGLVPQVTYVSAEVFDELLAELERPPRVVPALVRLFERESRFEK